MQFLSHHSFIDVCPCQGPIALQPPEGGVEGAEVVVVTGEGGVEVVALTGVTGPEVVVVGGFVPPPPLLEIAISGRKQKYSTIHKLALKFWKKIET